MPRNLISRPWTEQDDAKLRALVEKGKSSSALAVLLRRSQGAIATRKSKLGLTPRRARGDGGTPKPRGQDYNG